jgi:glutamate dehydrogenase
VGIVDDDALKRRIRKESFTTMDEQVMLAMLNFNRAVRKTNFFKQRKASLSFRLDPAALAMEQDWPTVPFGIFFVMGSDFQGFHVRFRDVSRGGIRLIRSADAAVFDANLKTQFAETYGLAYTQNKKNKDIPEFGSKGTILLNPDAQGNAFLCFKKYVSGLMCLLNKDPEVADNLKMPEVLFLGPDEGTADMMEWAAKYANTKGYAYWRAFTTGKPQIMGGIPHDIYGMTTRSVHRFVLGCLRKLELEESEVTKIQIGGPDGDLGSNEILISKDKTIGIADGAGVIYDPAGLDRIELKRLATKRVTVDHFDASKLGPDGFKVLVSENNVKLPSGEVVDSGMAFRNEFHLSKYASADLFVPCGGRPESINLTNVHRMFKEDGKTPKFKIIVEGANLFLTNDARMVLEDAGVVLFKDASTNKGGVTSSSQEVLVALALDDAQFRRHMTVKDKANPPDFYKSYTEEIQKRIERDADLEFECLWKEQERTGTHRFLLTEQVSDKINDLNDTVVKSFLWDDAALRKVVLMEALPKTITNLVGYEQVNERVPENYLKAIFAAHIASRYIYQCGADAHQFAFFGPST